jgi:hypothetical protein
MRVIKLLTETYCMLWTHCNHDCVYLILSKLQIFSYDSYHAFLSQ